MDELQLVRELIESSPEPDAMSVASARRELEQAIALDHRALTSVARRGGHRGRTAVLRYYIRQGRWPLVVAAVVVLIVASTITFGSSPGRVGVELGLQVSSASELPRTAPAHLLDDSLTIGYLPPGFSLLSASRTNSLIDPLELDNESLLFGKSGPGGRRELSIDYGPAQEMGPDGRPPMLPGTIRPFVIRRNPGYLATLPRTGGIGIGAVGTGQALQIPPAAPNLVQYWLTWSESPDVGFQVEGDGLALSQVLRVINGLTYHPSEWECWSASPPRATGNCRPGVEDSPAPTVHIDGTVISTGTVNSVAWVFSADVDGPGNLKLHEAPGWSTDDLYYAGGKGDVQGWSNGAQQINRLPHGIAAVSVDSEADGQRFAFGAVTEKVTSVKVTSVEYKTSVQASVLAKKSKGYSFFVLSLGRVGGLCDHLCTGLVTVTAYEGSTSLFTLQLGCATGSSIIAVTGPSTPTRPIRRAGCP